MKKVICVVLSVLLAVSCLAGLSGCGSSKKTTLYVYNWGQYISEGDDGSLDVIAAFEKAYPNIRVQYSTYDSNEIMYSKLANGGITVDVIIPSDYMIGRMVQEGMLEELNFDNIPNYQYIDDAFKNTSYDPENKYSVPYTWGTVGIIYNTKYVDEADRLGAAVEREVRRKDPDVRQLPGRLRHCRVPAGLRCEHHRRDRASGLRRQAGGAEARGAAVRHGSDF